MTRFTTSRRTGSVLLLIASSVTLLFGLGHLDQLTEWGQEQPEACPFGYERTGPTTCSTPFWFALLVLAALYSAISGALFVWRRRDALLVWARQPKADTYDGHHAPADRRPAVQVRTASHEEREHDEEGWGRPAAMAELVATYRSTATTR